MKSMTRRHLPSELISLIHHVELAEAGWRDRLIEQLVLSCVLIAGTSRRPNELRADLRSRFGVTVDDNAFARALGKLHSDKTLVEIGGGQLKASERAVSDAATRIEEGQALAKRVADRFHAIVSAEAPQLNAEEYWRAFCDDCLDPLVAELGARTYELIAGPHEGVMEPRSITAYLEACPEEVRKPLQRSIDLFLDPKDQDVRLFVLSRLHAHLLTLAASLSEQAITALGARMRSTVHLRIFVDTNFLFSILDLHDNPANEGSSPI